MVIIILHISYLCFFRYIQSLKPEQRYISNWEKQLSATPSDTNGANILNQQATTNGTGATGFLQNGQGTSVVSALWSLRDFMMKDALNLSTL